MKVNTNKENIKTIKGTPKNFSKEPPLAPTPLAENQPISAPGMTQNLSDKETKEKLRLYQKIVEKKGHAPVFQSLQEKYRTEMHQRQQLRVKQDVHFAQGWRTGLHANDNQIKQAREQADQNLRDQITKDAKAHYDQHHGLKQAFPQEKPRLKHQFERKGSGKPKNLGHKTQDHKTLDKD